MIRRAVLLAALLLQGACTLPEPEDGEAALQGALVTHQASLGAVGARQAALPRTAPGTAGQLVGQTPDAVLHWFGPPRLRRTEGSAEIWHYQASQCHLDLVLYPEHGVRPGLRVAFASARAVGTARRAEAACLRDLARGAAAGAAPAG